MRLPTIAALTAAALFLPAPFAAAQSPGTPAGESRLAIRAFGSAGAQWFSAASTFDAVLEIGRAHV